MKGIPYTGINSWKTINTHIRQDLGLGCESQVQVLGCAMKLERQGSIMKTELFNAGTFFVNAQLVKIIIITIIIMSPPFKGKQITFLYEFL